MLSTMNYKHINHTPSSRFTANEGPHCPFVTNPIGIRVEFRVAKYFVLFCPRMEQVFGGPKWHSDSGELNAGPSRPPVLVDQQLVGPVSSNHGWWCVGRSDNTSTRRRAHQLAQTNCAFPNPNLEPTGRTSELASEQSE